MFLPCGAFRGGILGRLLCDRPAGHDGNHSAWTRGEHGVYGHTNWEPASPPPREVGTEPDPDLDALLEWCSNLPGDDMACEWARERADTLIKRRRQHAARSPSSPGDALPCEDCGKALPRAEITILCRECVEKVEAASPGDERREALEEAALLLESREFEGRYDAADAIRALSSSPPPSQDDAKESK